MQADNLSSAMRSTQQHSLVLLATSILVAPICLLLARTTSKQGQVPPAIWSAKHPCQSCGSFRDTTMANTDLPSFMTITIIKLCWFDQAKRVYKFRRWGKMKTLHTHGMIARILLHESIRRSTQVA